MHLFIATGIFIPEIGGPATYAAKLAKEMLKFNHQVTVLTYSATATDDFDKDLPYEVVRVKRTNKIKNYFNYYKKFKQLMRQHNYDVVYCFDHFSAGLPVSWANRKFNKKLLIRVGGDFIWERYIERTGDLVILRQFYERNLHTRQEKLRFRLIKWVFKQAHKIIFTTEFQRDIFISAYDFNLNKTAIIHNPVDQVTRSNNIHQENKEILFAGRFIPIKNLVRLINVFKKIKTDKKLVLIGAGPQKNELIKLSQNDPRIKIENNMSQKKLWYRLSQAYLFILPSLTDLNPNVVLEALALHKPIILTQENGLSTALQNNFKLINPLVDSELQTAVEYFLDNNNYQQWIDNLNVDFINYTWQKNIQQHLEIFSKL